MIFGRDVGASELKNWVKFQIDHVKFEKVTVFSNFEVEIIVGLVRLECCVIIIINRYSDNK